MDKGIGGVLQIGYVRIQRDVGLLDDALVGACGKLFNRFGRRLVPEVAEQKEGEANE